MMDDPVLEEIQMDPAQMETLDATDPLAKYRQAFSLPEGVTYCDGMSLGALPKSTASRIAKVVTQEWGDGLIRSWNSAGWIQSPQRLGGKLAPIIGANEDEVVVGDSTSVNLFKLLVAAIRLRPGRQTILMESSNFPTDIYVARGVERLHPGTKVKLVGAGDLDAAFDEDVAVALLTHIDYKTSEMHDMKAVTARAHQVGSLVLWDLSHSTGAVPLHLNESKADMAVGCGYKYLNGGPGAPAFLFVARRHLHATEQPITAWIGHDKPFDFSIDYVPAAGVTRLLSGTPTILSMSALESGLDLWSGVDVSQVRKKSLRLSELFLRIVEHRLGTSEVKLLSPRDPNRRGSHLAFQHPRGYEVVQALIDQGVIGDFRDPDVMRFGFAPLYLRYVDVWRAATALVEVLQSRTWDQPRYRQRAVVT